MSRASRARRASRKKTARRSFRQVERPALFDVAAECDCPECSGAEFDPGQLIVELLAVAATLVDADDPLEAEVLGAMFVSLGAKAREAFEEALIDDFVPEFEARADVAALVMLLAIGAVAPGPGGKSATAAAGRLIDAGVAQPRWAAELAEPLTVTNSVRLYDTQGAASVLGCAFGRAGRSHAFLISVDNLACGAASEIIALDANQLPEALQIAQTCAHGFEIASEAISPADLRWHVENALDARAVHDLDEDSQPDDGADDGPGYPPMAALLRARMAGLPAPDKPPAAHRDDSRTALAALQASTQLAGSGAFLPGPANVGARRAPLRKLPAKRKKADRPAPVYQIKIGLRGTRPPIWRRLEVPGDISLAGLHHVIQVAFGWDDSHLHVFTTPYGDFGVANAELGRLADARVTLEQVAPDARSKISYTYDFGDDWEHDIVVEQILDLSATVSYPRCTGGRRAAPPDDCGGVWGYAELVEILGDPAHEEHDERLEWLGLDNAADFDPGRFDAGAVTATLSRMR